MARHQFNDIFEVVKGNFERRAMHELEQVLQVVSNKIPESNAPGSQEWLQKEDPLHQPFLTLSFDIDYAPVMNAHDAMKVALDRRERQIRQALQLSGITLDNSPGQTCQWHDSPNAPPCGLRCHSETALQTHIECKHTALLSKSLGLICRWSGCPAKAEFSQRINLDRHIQTHTGHKAYLCSLCSHAFSTSHNLLAHKRTHTGEKPFQCREPDCGYVAARYYTLRVHTRAKHAGENLKVPLPMSIRSGPDSVIDDDSMEGQSTSASGLRGGRLDNSPATICQWQDNQNAPPCGLRCSSKAALHNHIQSTHTALLSKSLGYICRWSGCYRLSLSPARSRFAQRSKLVRHMQSHTGHKACKCDICHLDFSTTQTLETHLRTHSGERPYKCSEADCGYEAAQASQLTMHMRSRHTGEKPLVCDEPGCGKRFPESSNLSKHRKTHEADDECRCVVCGKGFRRSDMLRRHMRTQGHKPYKCPSCRHDFSTSQMFESHNCNGGYEVDERYFTVAAEDGDNGSNGGHKEKPASDTGADNTLPNIARSSEGINSGSSNVVDQYSTVAQVDAALEEAHRSIQNQRSALQAEYNASTLRHTQRPRPMLIPPETHHELDLEIRAFCQRLETLEKTYWSRCAALVKRRKELVAAEMKTSDDTGVTSLQKERSRSPPEEEGAIGDAAACLMSIRGGDLALEDDVHNGSDSENYATAAHDDSRGRAISDKNRTTAINNVPIYDPLKWRQDLPAGPHRHVEGHTAVMEVDEAIFTARNFPTSQIISISAQNTASLFRHGQLMRRIKTLDKWRDARRERFMYDEYCRRGLAMLQLMYLKDRAVLWKRSELLRAETRSAQAPTKTVVLGRDSNITITLFGVNPSLSPKRQTEAFGDDSTSTSPIRGGLLTPDISDSNDEDFNIIVAEAEEATTEACPLLNERGLLEPQMISISAQNMESLLRNSRLMCHTVILSEGRDALAKRFLEDKDHRGRLATLQIMHLEGRAALRMRKSGLPGVESGSAQAPMEVIKLRKDRGIIIMLTDVVMSLSAELKRESDGDESVFVLPLRGGALSPDSSDSSDSDYNPVAKVEEAITEARALLREQISAVESRDLASHFRHAQEERRIEAMGLEEPDEEDEKTRAGDIRDLQQQAHEKEKGELKQAHEKIEAPLRKRKAELFAIERAKTVASPNMAKTNDLIVTSDALEVSQSPSPSPVTPMVRLPPQTTQPGDGSSSVGQLRGGAPSRGQRGCRCPLCHRRFRTTQVLYSHIRTHIGDKPLECKEPDCEDEAAYGSQLTIHTITEQNGEKPLVYDEPGCGRQFAVPDNLAMHWETHMRQYEMAERGGADTAPEAGPASLGQLRGGSSDADFQDILEANEVNLMLAGYTPLPYLGPGVDPEDLADALEGAVAERAEEIRRRRSFSDSPVVGAEPPVTPTGSIEEQPAPPKSSEVPELDMTAIEDVGQRRSGHRYPEQLPLSVGLSKSGLGFDIVAIEDMRQNDSGQLCPEQLPVSDLTSMQDAPKANGRDGFGKPSDVLAAITGRKTILDVMMMERVGAADVQYYAQSYTNPRPGAEIEAGGAASSVLYSSPVVSESPAVAMARRETFKLQGEDAQGWCYYNSSGMIFRDAVNDDPPVFPNWPDGVLPQPMDRGSVLQDASEVRMADPVLANLAASQQPIHDSQQTFDEHDDLVVTERALRMDPRPEDGVQLPPISSTLESTQLPPFGQDMTGAASLRSTHSIGLSTSAFLRNVRRCARYVKDSVRNDRHWLPFENDKSQSPLLHAREVSFEPDSESENEGPAKSIFPIPAPLDPHTAAELDAKLEASLTESAKVARWKDALAKVGKGKLSFSGLNKRIKNTLHGPTHRARSDSFSSDESDRLIEDADSETKKARTAKFIHRWNNYAHGRGGWWHTKHDKELQPPKQYLPLAMQHVKIAPPAQVDVEQFVFECNPALRDLFVENPYITAEFRKSNKIGLFHRVQAAKRKQEQEQERERGNGDELEIALREFMMSSKCKESERNVGRGRPRGGCLDEEEVVEVATVGRMKDGRTSLLADGPVWLSKKRKRECSGGCSFADDGSPLGICSELPPAKRRKPTTRLGDLRYCGLVTCQLHHVLLPRRFLHRRYFRWSPHTSGLARQ